MTPKHEANILVNSFKGFIYKDGTDDVIQNLPHLAAKQCALMCVKRILKSFESFMDQREHYRHPLEIEACNHWKSVKTEIENL